MPSRVDSRDSDSGGRLLKGQRQYESNRRCNSSDDGQPNSKGVGRLRDGSRDRGSSRQNSARRENPRDRGDERSCRQDMSRGSPYEGRRRERDQDETCRTTTGIEIKDNHRESSGTRSLVREGREGGGLREGKREKRSGRSPTRDDRKEWKIGDSRQSCRKRSASVEKRESRCRERERDLRNGDHGSRAGEDRSGERQNKGSFELPKKRFKEDDFLSPSMSVKESRHRDTTAREAREGNPEGGRQGGRYADRDVRRGKGERKQEGGERNGKTRSRKRRYSSESSDSDTFSSPTSSSTDTCSDSQSSDSSRDRKRNKMKKSRSSRKVDTRVFSRTSKRPDDKVSPPEDSSEAKSREAQDKAARKKKHSEVFENPDLERELHQKESARLSKDDEDFLSSKSKIVPEETSRAGGVYIPPFKLARMHKIVDDKSSVEYQKQAWEALRKSLNGLVNKVNVGNITNLVQELFKENLIRGRGLLARAIIRAQMASPGFTQVYSALLAIINSKLPEIGELVLRRVILQFRRAYRRNDKVVCLACVKFLGHLVNQRIAHELLALQLAALLLEQTTDDSVEVCVGFLKEVGQMLNQVSRVGFDAIFERLRAILHEGETTKKTQYTIETLWEVRRKNFQDYPGIPEGLDLVEEDEQICHEVDLLDESIRGEEMLNVFKAVDPQTYLSEDAKWQALSGEILGEESEGSPARDDHSNSQASSDDSEAEEDEQSNDVDAAVTGGGSEEQKTVIKDYTEAELIELRKTIYLCIMSSVNFEECVHKLLKLNVIEGREMEICTMLIDCCAMERTFQKFFALQAERLCRLNPVYAECFQEAFNRQYAMVHRLETGKLRNTAKFFAHLLYTDALPWKILAAFKLSEETTTSSGRIFIKIVLQELSENLGLRQLNQRFKAPQASEIFSSLFPNDHPKNIRFAINFFTAIGLGGLTEDLREMLQKLQQEMAMLQQQQQQNRKSKEDKEDDTDSSSDSSTDESDDDDISSDSSDSD